MVMWPGLLGRYVSYWCLSALILIWPASGQGSRVGWSAYAHHLEYSSWRMRGDSHLIRGYSYDTCADNTSAFGNQDNKGFGSEHIMEEVGWEKALWCALQIKLVWQNLEFVTIAQYPT